MQVFILFILFILLIIVHLLDDRVTGVVRDAGLDLCERVEALDLEQDERRDDVPMSFLTNGCTRMSPKSCSTRMHDFPSSSEVSSGLMLNKCIRFVSFLILRSCWKWPRRFIHINLTRGIYRYGKVEVDFSKYGLHEHH